MFFGRQKKFAQLASDEGFTHRTSRKEWKSVTDETFCELPLLVESKVNLGISQVLEGELDGVRFVSFEYLIVRRVPGNVHLSVVAFPRESKESPSFSMRPKIMSFLPTMKYEKVSDVLTDGERELFVKDTSQFRAWANAGIVSVFNNAKHVCIEGNNDWFVVYPLVVMKSFQMSLGNPLDVRAAPPEKLLGFLKDARLVVDGIREHE